MEGFQYDHDLQSIQEARILAKEGKKAQAKLAIFDEDKIEKIILNMVKTAEKNAEKLARMAVKETGFGNISDKTFKNYHASTTLYESIKEMKTVGIIKHDLEKK